jgi:beta-lactamase class A
LTLEDLARLMIVVSDNTATNLLIDRIGTAVVNDFMVGLGYEQTRLGRRMYDFAARDRGLENRCAAIEMTDLLFRLEQRRLTSPAASEAMLAIMKRQAHTNKIPRHLPPDTPVANKTGEITAVSHDVGLIYAPGGPIALSVLTEGARDRVAAEDAIGRVARAVYDAWGTTASG